MHFNKLINQYLLQIGLIDPGSYRTIEELVQKEAKRAGHLELLALKVVGEGDIEIS